METRKDKLTGAPVSLLGFGTMRLPIINGEDDNIDYAAAQEMIDLAYANGVNYYDTAYPYHKGASERFIGHALKKYPRESFFLADKMPSWALQSKEDVRRVFEEQLEKCQVDYFDYYLCHNVSAETLPKFEQYDVIAYLDEQKKAGRIRHLGFSFHDKPALLEQFAARYAWDFGQLQLNYLDWSMQDAKRQYEILTGRGIPVIVMEPVRGGVLATLSESSLTKLHRADPSVSAASWAMRFAASLPDVLTVLSGMSTLAQVRDNLATLGHFTPITSEETELLFQIGEEFRQAVTAPCTGCRYCMDCPAGVDIPAVFHHYNGYMLSKSKLNLMNGYAALPAKTRADYCVACGQCAPHCPQGIDIPARMADIAAEMAPLLA